MGKSSEKIYITQGKVLEIGQNSIKFLRKGKNIMFQGGRYVIICYKNKHLHPSEQNLNWMMFLNVLVIS